MKHKRLILAPFVLFLAACGSGFATELRLVLMAAPPVIEQLPLTPALKSGLVTDFMDMGGSAANLSDCIKAGADKPAKLICVQSFQIQVETIISRGHFGETNNPKLQRILGLIRGIVASARIYYGGGSSAVAVTEDTIKQQIKQLKAEMR